MKISKMNSSILKIKKIHGKSQKWPPAKLLHSDGKPISTIIWCSYSAKIKLQYIKNTFHVAHFHISMLFSTRNMFKEVQVIKIRGAVGTGFTYAPVCRAGGTPSTWFPPGTRRAGHPNHNFFFYFLLGLEIYISISSFFKIFQRFENWNFKFKNFRFKCTDTNISEKLNSLKCSFQ